MPKRNTSNTQNGSPVFKRSQRESHKKKIVNLVEPLSSVYIACWKYPDLESEHAVPIERMEKVADNSEKVTNWCKALAEFRKTCDYYDITLESSDLEQLQAHSILLRARIPFFQELLTPLLITKEPLPTQSTVIKLNWIRKSALKELLDYVYFAKTPKQFPETELKEVFGAALHMNWEELEKLCFNEFQERLSTENCLSWLEWAVVNKHELVKQRAASFAACHLDVLHDYKEEELNRMSLEAHLAIFKMNSV